MTGSVFDRLVTASLRGLAARLRTPEPVLEQRYRDDVRFRRYVDHNATKALKGRMLRRKRAVRDVVLEEMARELAGELPESAVAELTEQLARDYRTDAGFRAYIDGLAEVTLAGAIAMVAAGDVPPIGRVH